MAFLDRDGDYGTWSFKQIGRSIWLLRYNQTSTNIFTLTGATPDRLKVDVPAPFRLVRFEFYFSDTTSKTLEIKHLTSDRDRTGTPRLFSRTANTDQDIIVTFGEGYEFEDGQLYVEITGTAAKTVVIQIYVMRLS